MTENKVTPQMQHAIVQLQQYQQQAQVLAMQKQQLEMQLAEIENALDELKGLKAKTVFKSVGPVLVKTETAKIKKELAETKDLIDVRVKSIDKQEELLKKKLKELSGKLTGMVEAG